MPPVTATAAPPAVIAEPSIAVIVCTPFSNVSLANGLKVTGVSSFVVIASAAMSATGVTVMASVLATAAAMPSLVEIVRLIGVAGEPVL